MRTAFSETLAQMGKADSRILLLTGDHGYALFDEFRKHCPNQYFNAGIAEQNMVGMAAGLARAGFLPVVYGLASFVPIRVLEQIKLDVAHDRLHVLLVGDGAGFVYSHLGTSHQSTEDIAVTRCIPNLNVLSPADRFEQALCMDWAYRAKTSVYLRIGKADLGDVHDGPIDAPMGSLLPVRSGALDGIAFIATGSMVKTAIQLADEAFFDASVWSVPSIKPIDEMGIVDICRRSRAVVILEEHSTAGGLGSLVAEIAGEHSPLRVLRVGVSDRFSEFCGSYDYLRREHGLDYASVESRIRSFLTTSLSP